MDGNRDHINPAHEQSRKIKGVVTQWNPRISIVMDEYTASTVFGERYKHGADSLISGGINSNTHLDIMGQVLNKFIPAMGDALQDAVTEARADRNAIGLPQTISFLMEVRGIRLADQHFHSRVGTNLVKIQTILETASDDFDSVLSTVEDALQEFIDSDEDIIFTDSSVRETGNFTLIDINNGSVVHPEIEFIRTTPSEANLTRTRAEVYTIPLPCFDDANKLENLGLEVEKPEHGFNGTVETLIIETSQVTPSQCEGTYLNTVTTTARERNIMLPPGSFRVSAKQKNAAMAFIALELENIDSYMTFNITQVDEGEEYPVFRVCREQS
ncbi:uncharacterized protein J7T54_006624 [Emericellopsis cladophorae]|uniref:Uncharacterized protein n=1 Tax=Emericellopsis cladophorae TaxID=2686198 RepID=A0A9Q0BHN0_9HYPO|nr:uncharacterized protein J7T54_006624 [Emericellopsis cladophorae]KAI6784579.1 hypothetical protein J7T54_006624 [Emericellopsis cladophorae]